METKEKALSLIHQMLLRVDYPQWKLDRDGNLIDPSITNEVDINDNDQLDLLLTLAEVMRSMSDDNYSQFSGLVCYFIGYNQDNVNSRFHLIQLLLDQDKLILSHIFSWLEASKCAVYHENLIEYCMRHKRPVPVWSELTNSK